MTYAEFTKNYRPCFAMPTWLPILHTAEKLKEINMGLQGYSTPTPHTVVFSTNYPDILKAIKAAGLAEHIVEGRGRYRGKEEVEYFCDKPVFDELIRRWPGLLQSRKVSCCSERRSTATGVLLRSSTSTATCAA